MSLLHLTHALLGATVGVLLPETCPLCRRDLPPAAAGEEWLCTACVAALPVTENYCDVCSAPVGPFLNTQKGCGHCLKDDFGFRRTFAIGEYIDSLRAAVLSAKQAGGSPTAVWLADRLWERRGEELAALAATQILPVPQHWTRRLTAPHNTAAVVGSRLAVRLKVPYDASILRKVRRTPAQPSLVPSARRANLRSAFAVDARLDGQRILLVDDVLTTGTTADRVARVLLKAGAETVWVAVLARGIGQ